MLNVKKLLTKLLHGENISIESKTENKTIGTGFASVSFTPPTGFTKAILLSAYPRTSGNITIQGITVDTSTVRFFNQTNSQWSGECASYWLCVR